MTIEQLLDLSADKLEQMTDAELDAIFEPLLKVTRPATGAVRTTKTKTVKSVASHKNVQAEAARLLSMFANKI